MVNERRGPKSAMRPLMNLNSTRNRFIICQMSNYALEQLNAAIVACERCPRLIEYCRRVAVEKRRAYREQDYWGKPVPGLGDPRAVVLMVGLAPGAHGANRT